jgi:DNA-binding CsgD family transcriptional regulator
MFDNIFCRLVEDVTHIERRDEGHAFLKQAVEDYGLSHIAYLGLNIPRLTSDAPYAAVTYSNEWIMHYEQSGYVDIDPVVRCGLTGLLPLDWGTVDRSRPEVKRLFGEAWEMGVGCQGMSFPIRGLNGELALMSINSDASDKEWSKLKQFYMRDFHMLAHFFHNMVLRVEGVEGTDSQTPLSRRERQCLQWAAAGKTVWETAQIVGIGEHTASAYIKSAMHKLNCVTKPQAVGRAVSLGLIDIR